MLGPAFEAMGKRHLLLNHFSLSVSPSSSQPLNSSCIHQTSVLKKILRAGCLGLHCRSSVMERIKCLAERFQVATSAELDSSGALKLQEEEEQISHTCDNVTFFFGESVDAGKGTLFITTR